LAILQHSTTNESISIMLLHVSRKIILSRTSFAADLARITITRFVRLQMGHQLYFFVKILPQCWQQYSRRFARFRLSLICLEIPALFLGLELGFIRRFPRMSLLLLESTDFCQ
jgi:hypothetical protein